MIRPYNKIKSLVSGFDIDPFGLDFSVTSCYVMVLTRRHALFLSASWYLDEHIRSGPVSLIPSRPFRRTGYTDSSIGDSLQAC